MSEQTLSRALKAADLLRQDLFRESAQDESAAIAIATAFAMQCRTIWRVMGGTKMSAAQFYHFADTEATEKE